MRQLNPRIWSMDHWYEQAYEDLFEELHREPTEKEMEQRICYLQEQYAECIYDDME